MVLKLVPPSPPENESAAIDRVMSALCSAVVDTEHDIKCDQAPHGVAIIFLRKYPNGSFGESWIIEGMNALEAKGLLAMACEDISRYGLSGGPDHEYPDVDDGDDEPA